MRDTVFVVARAPRLGTIKRRLARDIGDRAALRFHQRTLARILRALSADRRYDTLLAATPDHARWTLRTPRVPQGHGDLGTRMHRLLNRRPHGRVLIVGCDIPGLTAADIRAAFKALGHAHAVFGPAEDGGYWLVGCTPRRPSTPFANARWSTEHALSDTLANFRHHRIALLRTQSDVDTAADLIALGEPTW